MYKRDNKKIAEFILKDADNTVIGITFVLGTIQNALSNVGKFMDGVANEGADSIAMTMKRNGYLYAVEHKHVLHEALKAAVKHNDPVGAIDVLTNVPNLGHSEGGICSTACRVRRSVSRYAQPRQARHELVPL